jgi:signal transduction histidine kinase
VSVPPPFTDPAGDGELPRLLDIAPVAGRIALLVSGLAIFTPAILLLWFGRAQSSVYDWLLLGVCLVGWLFGFFARRLHLQAAIQLLSGACLLIGAVFVAPLGGPGWIMPTTIAFAIIIGATFVYRASTAISIIIAVAILDAVVTIWGAPTAAFTENVPLFGYIGPLLDIMAGSGLVLARNATWNLFEQADHKQRDLVQARERSERENQIQSAHESVERRIHETVLNTLSGIAMGSQSQSSAQRSAQRDLRQLELGLTPVPDSTVSALIALSIDAAQIGSLSPIIRVATDTTVPSSMASVLRDALVEVLRNIYLHAGASTVTIDADVKDNICIVIADDGAGFSPASEERFGLRNSVKGGMSSLGGEATIASSPGTGVTVTLTAPALKSRPLPPKPRQASKILDESTLSRIGLLGTNLFLLVVAVPLALLLPSSLLVASGSIAYALINFFLAFIWRPRSRRILPIAAVAAAAFIALVLSRSTLDCTQSGAVTWLITGISGGGALLMIRAYSTLAPRIVIMATVTVSALVMTAALPTACAGNAATTSLVNLVYMAAVTYFFSWLDLRFERNRERMMSQWQAAVQQRLALEQRQITALEWNRLSSDVSDLLTAIASGTCDIDSPDIRSRATTATSELRARLGQLPRESSANTLVIPTTRDLTSRLAPLGLTIESDVIIPPNRQDALPDRVIEAIVFLIERSRITSPPEMPLTLTWLTDDGQEEILIRVPAQIDQSQSLPVTTDHMDDCEIEILALSPHLLISVRRPVSQRFTG